MAKSDLYLWDGFTKSESLTEDHALKRKALFAAARHAEWAQLADMLTENPALLHVIEPDDPSLNTILHYAALNNADVNVVEGLIEMDAARTRRNADGQRALDLAMERQHTALYDILEPELKHRVALEILQPLEEHFHALILARIKRLQDKYAFLLPQLALLLELDTPYGYFPVAGMYGGYSYWLDQDEADTTLWTFSASRVVGGSERLHQITTEGSTQVATGDEAAHLYVQRNRKNQTS